MKKIKVLEEKQVKGLFGRKKTVYETKTIKVDNKTYRKIKREKELRDLENMEILSQILED